MSEGPKRRKLTCRREIRGAEQKEDSFSFGALCEQADMKYRLKQSITDRHG